VRAVGAPAAIATWLARTAGITFARTGFSRTAVQKVRNRLFPGRDIPVNARCFVVVALKFSLGVDSLFFFVVGSQRTPQRRFGGKFFVRLEIRQRLLGGSLTTRTSITRTAPAAPAAARGPVLCDFTLAAGRFLR
jgi:hypothetical protein